MKVLRIFEHNLEMFRSGIVALEQVSSYPLGADFFQIDHGEDYFAFFNRLGKLKYYVLEHGGQPIAVGAGILREIPPAPGVGRHKSWYLCDLKVHPDFRGQHLPLKLLGAAIFPNYLRCRRSYAVSMNPGDGTPNRVNKLLQRFRWLPFSLAGQLEIFSLDHDRMRECRVTLEKSWGSISFLSLRGKKDLILQSTGSPLPLLHVQHGACGKPGEFEPQRGYTHMFCVPKGDPMIDALASVNIQPTAGASIIAHGMSGNDWKFILTSDI
jgi:hypothetical protein